MSRREHYSTALAQAQGITSECLALFELWQKDMTAHQLFEFVQASNALGLDSERRLRNVVVEGFGSRFLREPYTQAAQSLKFILGHSTDHTLLKQLILLYALRQHGISKAATAPPQSPLNQSLTASRSMHREKNFHKRTEV